MEPETASVSEDDIIPKECDMASTSWTSLDLRGRTRTDVLRDDCEKEGKEHNKWEHCGGLSVVKQCYLFLSLLYYKRIYVNAVSKCCC